MVRVRHSDSMLLGFALQQHGFSSILLEPPRAWYRVDTGTLHLYAALEPHVLSRVGPVGTAVRRRKLFDNGVVCGLGVRARVRGILTQYHQENHMGIHTRPRHDTRRR